ncbi:MAG: TatD family hydrolase [Candidatus Levyibacteriota bacterium]|nr:MAG: TatD family hydrolase [Candidatus Levybacteria bacterium]
MIDIHCHLNFQAYDNDYDEVAKRAFAAGVTTIINVGTKIDSSQKAVELAEKYDSPAGEMYAIVGVHPHHADKIELGTDWLTQLKTIAKSSKKVVAIGEIGMDNYRYQSNGITDPKLQAEIFIQQIELAHKLKLPLQIHNRHAGKEILDILINHKSLIFNPPGMFHCFSGNIGFTKKVLDLGFYVGFDGNITYKGLAPGEDTELSELVNYVPLDRIVIETDSPYLTPIPYRGKRNEPQYAILVGQEIAKIKGISLEEVDTQTTKNAKAIFRL